MLKQTRIKTLMICAVAILAIDQSAYAQIDEFKIIPDDGASEDWFGIVVSISGNYSVVGAKYDDDNGDASGSAYVFKRTVKGWVEEAKLLPSDGAAGDEFGFSVSISGDYIVVGSPFDDDNGDASGSAYVFKRTGTNWMEKTKLLPLNTEGTSDGDIDDEFGRSVSISGDYVVAGAYLDDDNGSYSGSAYVFKRTGTSWAQEQKLLPDDGTTGDSFGYSVSISDDYTVVGAFGDDDNANDSGSAYVFKRTEVGWNQEVKLIPTDGESSDYFGWSVSVSGDRTIVAARLDDDNGTDSGSAYIFKRTNTNWDRETKLLASDGAADDQFGIVVSISGGYAIVGAYRDDDNGTDIGSVFVYKRSDISWDEDGKLLASDGAAGDRFGQSVSISGGYAIVGSYRDDDNGTNSGSAYLYGFFTPIISEIIDVPHDQGGSVTLNWNASSLDVNVDSLPYYSIWRSLPDGMELQGMENGVTDITADFEGQAYRIESVEGNDLAWEWIANQPAHRFATYSYTAPTLFDSSLTTDGKQYFMVSAHTNEPNLFYDSMIDSGYSIDNLAPAVPTGLLASVTEENAVKLRWDEPVDEDFQYFNIYRSLEPDFDPTGLEPFTETIDTTFTDSDTEIGEKYYYILSAVDFNGNESEYTDAVEAAVLSTAGEVGIPTEFALWQNYPNPFNPVTTLRYDLPENSVVNIIIYDMLGRQIKTLVNQTQEAGYKTVIWDATNANGQPVGAGLYLYRISAEKFTKVNKMILLK